jgi:hypothetical protein
VEKASRSVADLLSPALLFVAAFALQSRSIGRVVIQALDEGVYLYAARLIADGLVPYRDFFLSHPPLLIAGAAAGLGLTGFDVPLFSLLYVVWVFSSLFPLYALLRRLSASRAAAAFGGVLLCVSPIFAGFDGRFFALRPASVPFLAWGLAALFGGFPALGGLLLAAFSSSVATNVVLGAGLLAAWTAWGGPEGDRVARRDAIRAWGAYAAFLVLTLAVIAAIPRGLENVFGFQLLRPRADLGARLASLGTRVLPENAVLLVLGLGGCALATGRARAIGFAAAAAFPLVILGPRSYYPHYVSVFAFPFAVTAALAADRLLATGRLRRAILGSLLVVALAATSLPPFLATVFAPPSIRFFRTVAVLGRSPEPLLAYEPIYALYARRRLTSHYNVADMRFFRVARLNLDEEVFNRLLSGSGTVLVEPFFASLLTPARRRALDERFEPVFVEPPHVVLVRRDGPKD